MKRSRTAEVAEREAEDIATAVDNKQSSVTRPPMPVKKSDPPLSSNDNKQTNTWLNPNSTWGI